MASSLIPIAFNYAAPKALIQNKVNGYLADYNDSDSYMKTIDDALSQKMNGQKYAIKHVKRPNNSVDKHC